MVPLERPWPEHSTVHKMHTPRVAQLLDERALQLRIDVKQEENAMPACGGSGRALLAAPPTLGHLGPALTASTLLTEVGLFSEGSTMC